MMKRKLAHRLLVWFVITLTGLAGAVPAKAAETTKQKVYGEPSDDKALVYLIRKGRFTGSARTMFVYADQKFLGVLDNGTYTFAYVDPGTHLFWTNWTRLRKEIDFIPGHVYYIEVWQEFDILPSEEGRALVEKVDGYATPRAKELRTAEELIRERYSKALRREEKMDKAEVEVVEARPRPADTTGFLEVGAYTEIPLELMENVTSYLTPTGDAIWFRVSSDVVFEGKVVVAAGTPVRATLRHSAKGEMMGVGGNFDIILPGVQAVDGSLIPLLGRLEATGKERTTAALAAGTATALVTGLATGGVAAIAVFFPRGREAFLLVGEEFKAWTQDNHWVNLRARGVPALEAAPTIGPDSRLRAESVKKVEFRPQKRRVPTDLDIRLESVERVQTAAIYEIGGWQLPTHLQPHAIVRRGDSWLASFGGWNFVRYARLEGDETIVPVRLKGTLEDGSLFWADAEVIVTIKGAD
jgi:hypothetical protein